MTPPNQKQAKLLEAYRLALLKNPQAKPPVDFNSASAEFMRELVASQRQSQLTASAKSRIWHDVLAQKHPSAISTAQEKNMLSNTLAPPRSTILKPRLALPLVAMLAFILIGGFILWGLTEQPMPPDTTNSGSYIQSTATSIPPTIPPPDDDSIALDLPSAASLDTEQIPMFYQSWNNSGAASLAMGLQYLGLDERYDQDLIQAYIRPEPEYDFAISPRSEDKFAQPWELAEFVNKLGAQNWEAITRINGNLDVIKRLITNDIPVIIATGYVPSASSAIEEYDSTQWFGHYMLVVGYDDEAGEIYLYDPYRGNGEGRGHAITYENFDADWRHMNRSFIALFTQKFSTDVSYRHAMNQILGDYGTRANNIPDQEQAAIEKAREEAENIDDIWAWLNLGEALANTENFEEAGTAFDQISEGFALDRILWYRQSILETYYQLQRYDELETLLDYAGFPAPEQEFIWYYHGRIKMSQGVDYYADAREDFIHALVISPNYLPAQKALTTVDDYLNRISYDTVAIGDSFELWGCHTRLDYGSIPDILPIGEDHTTITQAYDAGSHVGIDLEAPDGTSVYSASAGTVVFAGWNTNGYGNAVIIAHLNGEETYFTLYTHLSGFTAFCGQRLEANMLLGTVGSTGSVTDTTFHFEVRNEKFEPLDPALLFDEFGE